MALKTEIEYENIFGNHITLLTGLEREVFVKPMKQLDGTRIVKRVGNNLVSLTPLDNWCAYHIKFGEFSEEPYTVPDQSMVIAKRFLRVEYNFYGPEAANNALKLEKLLYTQASYQELIANGIVYSEVRQNVIDMDMSFNKQWWTRRNLSISYLEQVEIEFPAGIVDEIEATRVKIQLIDNIIPENPDCELIGNQTIIWNFDDGTVQRWESGGAGVYEVSNVSDKLQTERIVSGANTVTIKDTELVSVGEERYYIEAELSSNEWNVVSISFSTYLDEIIHTTKITYSSAANGFNTLGSIDADQGITYNFAGVFDITEADKLMIFQIAANFENTGINQKSKIDNVKLIKITDTIYEEMTAQDIFDDRTCQPGIRSGDQLLDNRTDFSAWYKLDVGASFVFDNYIKLYNDYITPIHTVYAAAHAVTSTQYTLLYKIYMNDNSGILVLLDGAFPSVALSGTVGVYSELMTSKASWTSNQLEFRTTGGVQGEYLGFRAALVKGNYMLLTELQKEYIIEKAEFGPFIIF